MNGNLTEVQGTVIQSSLYTKKLPSSIRLLWGYRHFFNNPTDWAIALKIKLPEQQCQRELPNATLHMGSRTGEGVRRRSSDSLACSVFGLPSKANSKNANGGGGLYDVVYPLCCSKTVLCFLYSLVFLEIPRLFIKILQEGNQKYYINQQHSSRSAFCRLVATHIASVSNDSWLLRLCFSVCLKVLSYVVSWPPQSLGTDEQN